MNEVLSVFSLQYSRGRSAAVKSADKPTKERKKERARVRGVCVSSVFFSLECFIECKQSLVSVYFSVDDEMDLMWCKSGTDQGLQDEESTDQTSTESLDSVCNAGEQQQILQTKLKMCSVKPIDCRNLVMKIKTEPTEIKTEPTEIKTEPTADEYEDKHSDGHDFVLSDVKSESCLDGEITSSTSEERLTAQTVSCITGGETLSSQRHLERKHSDQKYHLKKHTSERLYQCSECGKTFRKSSLLKSHLNIHSDEKPFQCSHCDKCFRHKSHLIVHERIHTGEKPHHCNFCEKSFNRHDSLVSHQRIHTGEKPHHCNVCGKSFHQLVNLVSHQRTHTGEKPYKCSQCEKTFTQSSNLKAHQRLHTGEKPYVCSICGERFAYSGSLQHHQKKHTI
ncbi:uncharacterized protein [Paramisgurnus dabryanus]|uniref:uncharacterized protein n=1 Tax=Paramisgurnus dabryanus TaxID=90735 RepID=UPI003CCF13FB